MGANMCRHLLKAGHRVNIYNRTKSKAEELLHDFPENSQWMDPADLAQKSDVIFTDVGHPKDV